MMEPWLFSLTDKAWKSVSRSCRSVFPWGHRLLSKSACPSHLCIKLQKSKQSKKPNPYKQVAILLRGCLRELFQFVLSPTYLLWEEIFMEGTNGKRSQRSCHTDFLMLFHRGWGKNSLLKFLSPRKQGGKILSFVNIWFCSFVIVFKTILWRCIFFNLNWCVQ